MELHKAHLPILKDLGLSETEALLYEVLLEEGPSGGAKVAQTAGVGRGNAYNALASLKKKGLVLEKAGKVAVFEAAPPSQLKTLLEREEGRMVQLAAAFAGMLPQMASTYKRATGKPVIQVFEGLDGLRQALFDSLESGEEILTYFDVKAVSGDIARINEEYVKERIRKQVPKRLLVADTPEARAFFAKQNTPFTEVRFVTDFPTGFETALEIYNGAISYLTLTADKQISVIVRDQNIYAMHRQQFEFLWRHSAASVNSAGSTSGSKAM